MSMDDMVDRCMDAMGSMMGSGMMGNGIILVVLLTIFSVWLVSLATGGADLLGRQAVHSAARPVKGVSGPGRRSPRARYSPKLVDVSFFKL